jgi:hypothetical protein
MTRKSIVTIGIAVWLALLGGFGMSAQDKYSEDTKRGRPSASAGTTA